MNKRLLTYLLT